MRVSVDYLIEEFHFFKGVWGVAEEDELIAVQRKDLCKCLDGSDGRAV